jgi:hypothetical protein
VSRCAGCDGVLPDGAAFCRSCGAPVNQPPAASTTQVAVAATPVSARVEREGRPMLIVTVVAIAVLVAAAIVVMVQVSGGAPDVASGPEAAERDGAVADTTTASPTVAAPAVSATTTSAPSAPTPAPGPPAAPVETTLPAPDARPVTPVLVVGVSPSCQSAASTDAAGLPVTYDAALLLDGRRDTAWRCDGDATGQTVRLTLSAPTDITEVGMIPGYDKIDATTGVDRWSQNRRVTAAGWRCVEPHCPRSSNCCRTSVASSRCPSSSRTAVWWSSPSSR